MPLARSAPRRVSRRRPPPDRVPHVAGPVVATFLAVAVCAALLLGCRTDAVGDATSEPSRPAPRPTTPRTAPATTPPGSVPEPEPGTTESTNPPSTARPVDPRDLAFTPEQREVIDAVRAARDAILEANSPPIADPTEPSLAMTMTGEALAHAIKGTDEAVTARRVIRLREPSKRVLVALSVVITDDHASFDACSIDDTITANSDTGLAVDDSVQIVHLSGVTEMRDGRWVVSSQQATSRQPVTWEEATCGE